MAAAKNPTAKSSTAKVPAAKPAPKARTPKPPKPPMPVETEGLIYLRIADELRERILSGALQPGQRLPSESILGAEFGASRTSVREALRVLVSQQLIETNRGAIGGSTVRQLDHRTVMEMLKSNMRAMVVGQSTSRGEMEDLREVLEVTATWQAAVNRTEEQLARLWNSIPPLAPGARPTEEDTQTNLSFHYVILEATGNRLLHAFSEPVLVTINAVTVAENEYETEYYHRVRRDHIKIAKAIEAKDQRAAALAMTEHVFHLRSATGLEPTSPFTGLTLGTTGRTARQYE